MSGLANGKLCASFLSRLYIAFGYWKHSLTYVALLAKMRTMDKYVPGSRRAGGTEGYMHLSRTIVGSSGTAIMSILTFKVP